MSSKDEARRSSRERIAGLTDGEKRTHSLRVCSEISRSACYRRAGALFAFYPFRGEIDILPLLRETLDRGIPLFLPRVEGRDMSFYPVGSLSEGELPPNPWGIREPAGSGNSSRGEGFRRPLMLVPGLAFTPEGIRLGRGGGFYDRFLGGSSPFLTAGVAYPVQIFPELPREDHDRILDRVFF